MKNWACSTGVDYDNNNGMRCSRRSLLLRALRTVVVVAVLACLLEVFLFNMNFFRTANYDTINLNDRLTVRETADGFYQLSVVDKVLEFNNLNTSVHNIHIDFDEKQSAQQLTLKINFTDEAHLTYFDTTEYTEGVPRVAVNTLSTESEYINLTTTGRVDSLRIEIVDDDQVHYPLRFRAIEINAREPFVFNGVRFIVVAGIMLFLFLFRPRSVIYRIGMVEHPRFTKCAIIGTVLVEIFLMSSFLFMGSNLVGVATHSYNYGSWDGKSVVNTYETGGDNAQQYSYLAKALVHGQLYLEEEPPQWLKEMDDPYDKEARDEMQKETGEEYLFDVAYYDGRYYVYFGIVPALLFYVPFYLLTGQYFPSALGVLIAAIAFVLGCSALLDRFARYHFKHVSLGLYLLLQIPLVTCCGVLYLLKFPTFYSLPIMCGLAFSVWGLYLWMRGRVAPCPKGWFLAGSFCMALVVGCRPQLVVLSLVAIPLFWRTYITKRRILTPSGMREFICLVAPYCVVAAGIMGYNYARFSSPFDFGANYNLTVNDMTRRGFSFGRFLPALFAYFFQPPNASGVFPFLQPTVFETTYLGQTIRESTFGGIFACLPLLWILPFAGRILKLRFRQRSTNTVAGVVVVLLSTGFLVALLDAQVAGILQRYFADFSFMFLAASVLLAFIANENIEQGSSLSVLFTHILMGLVMISVVYSTFVCFIPETGWISDVYPWAYQDLLEMVLFWT